MAVVVTMVNAPGIKKVALHEANVMHVVDVLIIESVFVGLDSKSVVVATYVNKDHSVSSIDLVTFVDDLNAVFINIIVKHN